MSVCIPGAQDVMGTISNHHHYFSTICDSFELHRGSIRENYPQTVDEEPARVRDGGPAHEADSRQT